jgi:tetratricopeptide (TPR) repeat protein
MSSTRADLLRDDRQLRDYFTDREVLCRQLEDAAVNPAPPVKRIWNITGDVGQGKSAVLRMLRLTCWEDRRVRAGYLAGRRQLTEVEFLKALADSFADSDLHLKAFQSRFKQWDAQVARAAAAGRPGPELAEHLANASEKVGSAAGSLHPASAVGGAIGSAFIQLWLDITRLRLAPIVRAPAPALTKQFVQDFHKAAARRRLVILLDQYEEFAPLDLWMCDLLRQLTAVDAFIVIASRVPVGSLEWDGIWPHWWTHVETARLEPLGSEHRTQLVVRLHKSLIGTEPDAAEVQAILDTGGRSPLGWQLAIIMRRYGYKGRQTRRDDLGQIVDYFLKRTPAALRPLVEAVSVARRLDRDMLRVLTESNAFEEHFETDAPLRTLVTRHKGEWIMLPSLREVLDDYIRETDPDRYRALHEKAARHYGERIASLAGAPALTREQRERQHHWEIEQLYHDFHASSADGLLRFRDLFERSLRGAERLDFCRALLNEVRGYDLGAVEHNWLRLYEALLTMQERSGLAEPRRILEELRHSADLDKPLRIAVLESLAVILLLHNAADESKRLFEECLQLCESYERDLPGQARALIWLGSLSKKTGTFEKYFSRAAAICGELGPLYASTGALLNKEIGDAYRLKGRFREAEAVVTASIDSYRNLNMEFDLAHALRTRAMLLVYMGKLREAERLFRESVDLFDRCSSGRPRMFEEVWLRIGVGDLALAKGDWTESRQCYERALELSADAEFERAVAEGCLADLFCAQGEWERSLEIAERSLAVREKVRDLFGIGWVLCSKGIALMRQARYPDALDCFNRGVDIMHDYGSEFVLAKLRLARGETYLLQGDDARFWSESRDVYELCARNGYADVGARQRLLDGFAMVMGASTASEIADRFGDALTWALRHNVFTLDAIASELLDRLAGLEQRALPDKASLVRELRSRWMNAVIEGERAVEIEGRERESNRAALRERVSVSEQLNRGAVPLGGTASAISPDRGAHHV